MQSVSERAIGTSGDGGEVVVAVGVKFDSQSKQLLTWALMKMANPGDRVIAIHVLDSISGGTASPMSLVTTFDSFLAVYEGFCNLKQVDLKLKVCRGSSVRKILVREAKASNANKFIVGTSKSLHTFRSSTSVAKYCARKLPKSLSVYAVSDGQIVYTREATIPGLGCSRKEIELLRDATCTVVADKLNQESQSCSLHSSSGTLSPDKSKNLLSKPYSDDGNISSLPLLPNQRNDAVSRSNASRLSSSKQPWSSLQQLVLGQHQLERHPVKEASLAKWELKQSKADKGNGGIVPINPKFVWSPITPYCGSNDLPEELKGVYEKYSSICRLFCYEELLVATSNFTPGNMVGKGGSSHVYKGCLPDGKELAVKILKPCADMMKEFVGEIEIITTLRHRNVMSLFGFCFEDNNLILVYDFLSRGSLEENLHANKEDLDTFGWQERYKVALGVAEALDYLHNSCDQLIVHRDVKSSNILLSDDFEPQLSDFGFASCISRASPLVTSTDVSGTFGYLAPEYFLHGKVSDKVDVFAYGVVLLELLSGKLPINSENPKCHESLAMWAKPILEGGQISELLDPHIRGLRDVNQIERMVLAATLSIRRLSRARPEIRLIVKLLQGNEEATKWARQQMSASEEVDAVDDELHLNNVRSHLNTALLDLEDDCNSLSSSEQSISTEDYLEGRYSRASSFE
ncbi:hypothetical protein K2173_012056 [Erythroxylum novogranatense]|uniref:Protein kinase domain-containing protein n=1 Tax=Erythroxylum novogranatense TaxID=1862640 RepID=A0AAV8TH56_9ROSI|nr:hypothetical protein K2173_012056 [Erythroxylum novogranatense]